MIDDDNNYNNQNGWDNGNQPRESLNNFSLERQSVNNNSQYQLHQQEQEQGKEEYPSSKPKSESKSSASAGAELSPNSSLCRRIRSLLTYTPHRCRWDPANPVKFSWALTFLFGFATTFTVCSYYI